MTKVIAFSLGLSLLASAIPARGADGPGISFSHHDWEIACDNTRTCRAAGYQDDSGEHPPVSVLLTRKAGPHERVSGELRFGELDDEHATGGPLTMHVNGQSLGKVVFGKADGIARLTHGQSAALVTALTKTSRIEWSDGKRKWRLSDKGSAAVLLKMDEFQGRLGTPGALVRKGDKDERSVLPAVPAPVVQAAAVPAADVVPLSRTSPKGLHAALEALVKQNCSDDSPVPTDPAEDLAVYRLSETKLLVSATCWRAAYNQGTAYWLINAQPPYRPEMVTSDGSDYDNGTISAGQKGRGIGDCWSFDEWTWDGQRFVHTSEGTTGQCKEIAAGGAWSLPVLVTTVRPAPKRATR